LIVDPELSNSFSDSNDKVSEIIEISPDSDVKKVVEFEPVIEIKLVFDIVSGI
jgi:hypothetical protein